MIINSTLSLSPQQIKIHLKLCSCAKRHSTSLLQCVHRCNGPYSNVGYNSLHLSRRTYIIHNRIESDLCTATKHLDHVRRRLCGYQSPPSMSLSTSVALALPLPLSIFVYFTICHTKPMALAIAVGGTFATHQTLIHLEYLNNSYGNRSVSNEDANNMVVS